MLTLLLCAFMLLTTTTLPTNSAEQPNETHNLLVPFVVPVNDEPRQPAQPRQPIARQPNDENTIIPQHLNPTTRETQCCWVATAFGGFLAISYIIGSLIRASLHQ